MKSRGLRVPLALILAFICSVARGEPEATAPFRPAIETLADKLVADYVFPDAGAAYAQMLRAHLAAGDYDGVSDPAAIAARLTSDLQTYRAEGHLRVERAASAAPTPSQPVEDRPPSILAAKWGAPGIAYISFSLIPDDPAIVGAIDRFMREHASARSIIIDARKDHGGGIGGVDAIFRYLYAKPRLLGFFDERAAVINDNEDSAFDTGPTVRKVAGPAGFDRYEHSVIPDAHEKRLFRARVFYLTSHQTASAGEYMAHILETSGRGEIIGETTFGADHFGAFLPIGQGLRVFMPWGRLSDPVSGQDWEGKGVAPTIPVAADQALDVALRLAQAPPHG